MNEKLGKDELSERKEEQSWCCYYDQHYHQCYTGKAGCVLSQAIEFQEEAATTIVNCSPKLECHALLSAGYFLRGFRRGCPECKNKDKKMKS